MFNYNIENIQLLNNNDKCKLVLKGWAFDTEQEINIKVIDDKERDYIYNLQKYRRNDVFKYFDSNSNSLDSGINLEVNSVKKNAKVIKIIFLNKQDEYLAEHIVDIKKLRVEGFNNKISYKNIVKLFNSIRKDGIKHTIKLLISLKMFMLGI